MKFIADFANYAVCGGVFSPRHEGLGEKIFLNFYAIFCMLNSLPRGLDKFRQLPDLYAACCYIVNNDR